jgi:hypothetical protein
MKFFETCSLKNVYGGGNGDAGKKQVRATAGGPDPSHNFL